MRAYVPFRRNRTLAIVLAVFTGAVGGHKFYLGRVGWGIVYAACCWTYVPAFLALVEAICYACLDDQAFDERYNSHLPPIAYPIPPLPLSPPARAPMPLPSVLTVLGVALVIVLVFDILYLITTHQ